MSSSHPPRLTDPDAASDYLRRTLRPAGRQPTVLVVPADALGEPITTVELPQSPAAPSVSECATLLDHVLEFLEAHEESWPASGLLLAVTRPGGDSVAPFDRVWFRALYRICHARGLSVIGMYIVGQAGVREVQIDDAA